MQAIVPLFAGIAADTEAVHTVRRMLSKLSRAYDHTDRNVRLELSGGDGTHHMYAVVDQSPLDNTLARLLSPEPFMAVRNRSGRRAVFGDKSRGPRASHQTGWTATISLLLQFRGKLHLD